MTRAGLVVALVGCQQSIPPAPAPPPAPPPADARVVVADAAFVIDAPVARTTDDDFKDAVRAFAKQRAIKIGSWGTLRLDGSKKPYRYAGLVVPTDENWRPICKEPCTGAYLIEQAPDRYWEVATWWTAGVFHEPETMPTGEPSWDVLEDTWIQHRQIHNHGDEEVAFALRKGKLVVLEDHDYNSRREPESTDMVYAKNGVCRGTCPELAKHETVGIYLEVLGPAASIAALPEPHPM